MNHSKKGDTSVSGAAMKKILSAVAFAAVLFLLSACGKDESPSYRSDLTASEITSACLSSLSSNALLDSADEDYIKYRLLPDGTAFESCSVYIQNAGTSIDEIGVVQSSDEDSEALYAAVTDYLSRRNEEWTGQYLVEEYPKLRDAECKRIGSYVVYAILSEEDKTSFFNAVSELLRTGS